MIIKIDHSLVWQKGLKSDVGRIVEKVAGWGISHADGRTASC